MLASEQAVSTHNVIPASSNDRPSGLVTETSFTQEDWQSLNFQNFPSFFESIMVPSGDWAGEGEVDMPPDMSTMIPEHEDWAMTDDIFGFDFSNAFEQALDAHASAAAGPGEQEPLKSLVSGTAPSTSDNARQRHLIFQNSPWYASRIPAIGSY